MYAGRHFPLTERSLITSGGEWLQNGSDRGGGGATQILPIRIGGGGMESHLSMVKREHNKFWGSFNPSA